MPAETSFFPADHEPTAAHFAAYLGNRDSHVIGVASIYVEPEPAGGPGRRRLRGMAVEDEHRRTGAGAALIARVRDYIGHNGGGVIWCNARVTAQGFYERVGFVTAGDVWEEPGIGPHIRMHEAPRSTLH